MTNGIYTIANDVVYNQLVAFLNSVEVNVGTDIPVCVIAYDDNIEKVSAEVASRKNVTLLNDAQLFKSWEDFSLQVWQTHPTALKIWEEQGIKGVRRIGMNRRYCAFDNSSLFDKFAYFDADILVLDSLQLVFEKLQDHPLIVYDFQYKDPSFIFNTESEKLATIFSKERINSDIFCAGFYAGTKGLFTPEERDYIVSKLESGEAEILLMKAPNQSVLNYMVMRCNIPVYNLSLQLPANEITGCAVTSEHFELKNNLLYDKGSQLTYLHYIGLSSSLFDRVCNGENIDFPYRDIFLHYRYLHEPEKRPKFTTKPRYYNAPPSLTARVFNKLGLKT